MGIENLLSSHIQYLVVKKRQEHFKAVLTLQRKYKGFDHLIEMLVKTSQESARWVRKSAFMLASGFARCDVHR